MTAPTRDEELRALRRPFTIGVALVVLVVVALGVVIARFGSTADRPAGIAERWLVAVGDTTRDGVEDDGVERATELGAPPELASRSGIDLRPAAADGERAFESVRTGRSVRSGSAGGDAVERVAFEVVPHEADPIAGHLYLVHRGDGWRVLGLHVEGDAVATLQAVAVGIDLGPIPTGPIVIERPERAPLGWFVGALLLGGLITAGCVAAVRAATPAPR